MNLSSADLRDLQGVGATNLAHRVAPGHDDHVIFGSQSLGQQQFFHSANQSQR